MEATVCGGCSIILDHPVLSLFFKSYIPHSLSSRYIESSAQWYMAQRMPNDRNVYVEVKIFWKSVFWLLGQFKKNPQGEAMLGTIKCKWDQF